MMIYGYILILVLLVVLISLIIRLYIKWENKQFRITEYSFKSSKIKRNITLAVLTDLHNYEYGKENELLLEQLKISKPDYVISAGDMIEASKKAENTKGTIAFLEKVAENFNFIYGCGNHEWKLLHDNKYSETAKLFRKSLEMAEEKLNTISDIKSSSIRPLDNKNIELSQDNIKVYGLNLEKDYFIKIGLNKTTAEHIRELVGTPTADKLNILIGHNPDQFEAYSEWGADLVLSGHIHGGMIATPWHRGLVSPRFIPFPKYDWGVYKKKKSTMILGRGLGNHTIHIRIFNRAELMIIKLIKE